jgi:hypothetical protein
MQAAITKTLIIEDVYSNCLSTKDNQNNMILPEA